MFGLVELAEHQINLTLCGHSVPLFNRNQVGMYLHVKQEWYRGRKSFRLCIFYRDARIFCFIHR